MNRQTLQFVKLLVVFGIVALTLFAARQRMREEPDAVPPAQQQCEQQAESAAEKAIDQELAATLARIDAGKKLRFRNDGSVFENRERRLPRKPAGYYREWVHPTPGVEGPGARRMVTGKEGEVWYTPDHYKTFERVR